MTSLRLTNRRRRSQSTVTSPSNYPISEGSRLGSAKRTRPHSSFLSDFSSCKRDHESWKTKRRRSDFSRSGISSDDDVLEEDHETGSDTYMIFGPRTPTPALAATSAEFHLFSRPSGRARLVAHNNTTSFDSHDTPSLADLNSLRSNAFWELQRSVMENGEGLVRRMRDYERTRSRAETHTKVKDAQKRGKKRSTLLTFGRRAPSPLHDESEEEGEDDDIQIYSGELPQPFPRREIRHKTSSGSDILMDAWSAPSSERCSSPCSSFYMTDEEHLTSSDINPPSSPQQETRTLFPNLTTSYPVSETVGRTPSFFPPSSSGYGSESTTSINSSYSEKAIAALTLALANGSASINDYEALRNLQPVLALEDSQVGEMWH